jgi:hypothetical protein
LPNLNERFDRGNKNVNGYIDPPQPLVWGSSHNGLFFVTGDLFFVTGRENQRAARPTPRENLDRGKTLTRLAALGPLSRDV